MSRLVIITFLLGACSSATPPDLVRCDDNGDCAALMAGLDPCSARAICDEGLCRVDSAPVTCEAPACQVGGCDSATGACVFTPVADGVTCSDGSDCTSLDSCRGGACAPGPDPCTASAGPCEVGVCDPATGGCVTEKKADFSPCDDGDGCTSDDTCLVGACRGAPRVCPEPEGPCVVSSCDRATGQCLALPHNDGIFCDDGDACTLDTTCESGTCGAGRPKCESVPGSCQVTSCEAGVCSVSAAPNGEACDDANRCTVGETCDGGTCGSGAPKCPQSTTTCISIVCDLTDGGCIKAPVAGPCNDGNACTTTDACASGQCLGVPVVCADDAPCHPVDCNQLTGACVAAASVDGLDCNDGDLCTTFDRCLDGACAGAPACPDDGSTCTLEACDPTTGGCSVAVLDDGLPCEDKSPCTGSGVCSAGACVGGAPVICPDDGSNCTLEPCEAIAGGCVSVPFPDGAACDDGDPCTSTSTCDRGLCEQGAATVCESDGDPCTAEACDPVAGCRSTPLDEGAACDDGEPCTTDDRCAAGSCVGAARTCEGAGPCSFASCTPGVGCTTSPAPDGDACDDQSACTSGDQCQGGVCTPKDAVVCAPTGEPCLDARCEPSTGACVVMAAEVGRPCDDGSICTVADACAGSVCVGAIVQCESPSECTRGVCDSELGGCAVVPLDPGAPCATDDVCTVPGTCSGGVCSSAAVVCPDDQNPCTAAACVTEKGCQNKVLPAATPCDDGDPCTPTAACNLVGACVGVGVGSCPSDGNPCTSDACTLGEGCVYAPSVGGACDDGDLCTTADVCLESGRCEGTTAPCADLGDSPCVLTRCDPVAGCVVGPVADGTACDDSNLCTLADRCEGGLCTGDSKACPQASGACEMAVCDGASGACVTVAAVGVACDDGLKCTVSDACAATFECRGAPRACPDGAPCALGYCVEGTGACGTSPAPDGAPCDDGGPCLSGDRCLAGVCRAGTTPKCVANAPCLVATCDGLTGACSETERPDGHVCDDGSLCTLAAACTTGLCLRTHAAPCDDGDPCTVDTCVETLGCTFTPYQGGCNDGLACTVNDTCGLSGCVGTSKTCPNGPCDVAACDPSSGVCVTTARADGTTCTDDEPCTEADACVAGRCVGVSRVCASPAPCQVATCAPGLGCVVSTAADGEACDDDPCLAGETCAAGVCSAGTPIDCPHGPCTTPTCSAAAGCGETPVDDGIVCTDGDVCRTGGVCLGGVCDQVQVTCPSPDACHLGVCLPGVGCTVTVAADGTACTDGDRCTLGDTCLAGACASGAPKTCAGSACEPENCDAATGECAASLAPAGAPCDDGNACTTSSSCSGGQCVGSGSVSCPPTGDSCTVAACVPATGCSVVAAPAGTSCDDGDACTSGDGCQSGRCVGVLTVSCGAPVGCVGSVCEPSSGVCVPTLLDEGAPCDDADPCAHGERCVESACVGSAPNCCTSAATCDDERVETLDECIDGQCAHRSAAPTSRVLAADGAGAVVVYDEALTLLAETPLTGVVELADGGTVAAARDAAGTVTLIDPTGTVRATAALAAERVGMAFGSAFVVRGARLERRSATTLELQADLGPAPLLPLAPFGGDAVIWVPSRLGRVVWYGQLTQGAHVAEIGVGGSLTGAAFDPVSGLMMFGSSSAAQLLRGSDGGVITQLPGAVDAVASVPGASGFVLARGDGSLEARSADGTLVRTLPLSARARSLSTRTNVTLVTTAGAVTVLDADWTVTATQPGVWRAAVWLDASAP